MLMSAVLDALNLIDQSLALSADLPPAALALDDLVLRCLALLLAPTRLSARPIAARDLNHAVDLAMAWMSANLERPISLTDIEQQVGYGRRALQQAFRSRVGCGPMQWLRRQRLSTAHALIRASAEGLEPPLQLQALAQRCGYINYPAFSRDFSRLYGMAPSRLLRQVR